MKKSKTVQSTIKSQSPFDDPVLISPDPCMFYRLPHTNFVSSRPGRSNSRRIGAGIPTDIAIMTRRESPYPKPRLPYLGRYIGEKM